MLIMFREFNNALSADQNVRPECSDDQETFLDQDKTRLSSFGIIVRVIWNQ